MIEQQVSKAPTPLNLGESVDRSADAANREQSLVKDLERLLRFASTAKGIEVPKEVLEEAAKTLQEEQQLIQFCRSPRFTLQELSDRIKKMNVNSDLPWRQE